jgi:hypothetical protein
MIALAWLAAALLWLPQAQTSPPRDAELETLAAWLVGEYSTADQVEADQRANATYRHDHAILLIAPVSLSGFSLSPPGSRVLYLEQALAGQEAMPYRQRILTVFRTPDGRLTTRTHRISEPGDLVGATRALDKLNRLRSSRVTPEPGCDVTWTRVDRFLFAGTGGNDRGCRSTMRGATYVTTQSDLTADTLISLDQGFDESGSLKWGPPPGVAGHIFRKRR